MSNTLDSVQATYRVIATPDGYRVERREYRTSEYEQGNSVTRTQQYHYEVYNRWGQIETPPAASAVDINT